MAKKKRQPRESPPTALDRRVVEEGLRELVHSMEDRSRPDTPLERAQSVMYRAFQERDETRRVQLAREALDLSPDCADAYVLLAEHARSQKEGRRLYEQGVAAGQRALGPRAFDEYVGHFWGVLETRPYMRARLGLAEALWAGGLRDEAVDHLREMLRLNPNDNQGIRYILAGFLLYLDRDDDLAALLEEFPEEGSATWAYTRALLAFRRQGDTIESRRLLKAAKKVNKHVPDYLARKKTPPEDLPPYYGMGDENEAIIYVSSFLIGWKSTEGAIAWVRANLAPSKRKGAKPQARGPGSPVKKWLRSRLRQCDDVWQADVCRPPLWVRVAGELVRPWLVLVTNRTEDLVLGHMIVEDTPSADLVWDILVQAMQHPKTGEPHRPAEIEVRPLELWETLRTHVEEIGVLLTTTEALDHAEFVQQGMVEHLGGGPPGLSDIPDLDPPRIAQFYEAAASFFDQAPWKKVGYESAIRIEGERFPGGPWYGVIMGQLGLTVGLALYFDLSLLKRMFAGLLSDEQSARLTESLSLTFNEEWNVSIADSDAARRHGWKLARPDAYPEVIRKEVGMSMRLPTPGELDLMEACTRAVPEFVTRRKQDDPSPEEITVPIGSETVKLTLSWVEEE